MSCTVAGDPSRGWAKMPRHMLAECAEADAWRRLFPDELGWLHLADSADTANEPARAHPDSLGQPTTPRSTLDVLGTLRTSSDTTSPRRRQPTTFTYTKASLLDVEALVALSAEAHPLLPIGTRHPLSSDGGASPARPTR
ncbi:hypothetical protein U8260_29235 [Nocardia sp. CDC192]|nr:MULTISPECIES: hypothetical protein [unclassified Nocardia]MBF6195931.1 hypothetical protein [Nocardia beijingensis]MEA3532334.1 hypothetical protein [Nocardia sp. CDC192]